jgi:hypothetical protein
MGGNFDPSYFSVQREIRWYHRIMIYLMFPYYNTRESIKLLIKKDDCNVLSDQMTNTGRKKAAAAYDIELEDVKKIYKSKNVSINEFYFGAVSLAFYRYIEKRNKEVNNKKYDKVPDYLNVVFPMNWRTEIKKLQDVRIDNQIVPLPIDLYLRPTFDEALKATAP